MRIWSIHPKYLDSKGLVALWRETLLAQKVLQGDTKGYKNHPQLNRFKATGNPVATIGFYLVCVAEEADSRGYNFNRDKIADFKDHQQIKVTGGQVEYEYQHLLRKLEKRDPELYSKYLDLKDLELHPIFEMIEGDVEDWEVLQPPE